MIPLHDVVEQNRSIRPELDAATKRVLDSGILIGGNEVAQFEYKFSSYLGVQHTVGVGNATDGFEIAFKALNLKEKDEVIIPANAHVSPALAALNVGLRPVFCDVEKDRMLLSGSSVQAVISPRTKVIVVVHLYGRVCPMDELLSICSSHDITLVEDFSQAHGASFNGQKVGSFGKLNVCSFYPTKPLGALGDGGAITTNDSELAQRCRVLAQYGWNPRDNSTLQGQNSRLDAIQAAALSVKLNYLDQWNFDRVERAQNLIENLDKTSNIQVDEWQEGDICHLFPVRTANRKLLVSKLNQAGIECGIHFPIPVHRQETFGYSVSLPIAENCCSEVLSVPLRTPCSLIEI